MGEDVPGTEIERPMPIESLIIQIRGSRVIIDSDLARVYGVSTGRLNEAVKRNVTRFPVDFAFPLTRQEVTHLISQFATSRSHGGRRKLPGVFTEHGALMAANVLNSPEVVQMSVVVVRAFVRMRQALVDTAALRRKLDELERKLTERLDVHEQAILRLLRDLHRLMSSPAEEPPPKRIGFHVKELRPRYASRRP